MAKTRDDADIATAVFTWDVAPGRQEDFENWAQGIHRAAAKFPGHLGATWLRAEGARGRYYTVVRFAQERQLKDWLNSTERAEWIERLDEIAHEQRYHTTGMETWFSVPGEALPPPARWKMVVVTFCAVYPLSVLFQWLVTPATDSMPLLIRAFFFPLVVVPLLTYVLMPGLSRTFRRWLYPAHRAHPPAEPADFDVDPR